MQELIVNESLHSFISRASPDLCLEFGWNHTEDFAVCGSCVGNYAGRLWKNVGSLYYKCAECEFLLLYLGVFNLNFN